MCAREIEWEPGLSDNYPWKPFCSERCQMIDLGRWASGEYRIVVPGFAGIDENEAELTGESGESGELKN
jgi:uncharacterized protein